MKTPSHWVGFACRWKVGSAGSMGPAVAVLDAGGRLVWHGIAPLVEVRHFLRLDASWITRMLGGATVDAGGGEWWPAVATERLHRAPRDEQSPYQLGRIQGTLEGLVSALDLTWVEIDRENYVGPALGRQARTAGANEPRLLLEAGAERWPELAETIRPYATQSFPWPAKGQAKASAIARAAWIADRARVAAERKESA